MNRRVFLKTGTAVAGGAVVPNVFGYAEETSQVYVSPDGHDSERGTEGLPLRTVEAALRRLNHAVSASVLLLPGTYYLETPMRITPELFGGKRLSLRSTAPLQAVLSGGQKLKLDWRRDQGEIWKAQLPAATATDQLFINGERQVLARYPNFDKTARYLDGSTTMHDVEERSKRWKNPAGAYLHALQQSHWGSLHYRIAGRKPDGRLDMEGGWQINRKQPMDENHVFVENVREEVDEPGEWFLDSEANTLYYWPHTGIDLNTAVVEIATLESVLQLQSHGNSLVQRVSLEGLTFRHTRRTFMKTREPVVRSDWNIYRSGAVLFSGTNDCSIEHCFFDQLGGNAVFLDGHNERTKLKTLRISRAGASGICVIGKPESVRDPLTDTDVTLNVSSLDRTPGPRSAAYPSEVQISDCLIERTGRIEKQSAGIVIDIARRTLVDHCTIYGVPRAGINIGDGAWGGHHIRNCDIFDTVLETSDHGAFNSWGRDRWWHLEGVNPDTISDGPYKDLSTLDAVEPNILEHSRWACTHGWDIDLDDGSSNYIIRENVCLNGGIKLREGFYRQCLGNLMVNNTLHPHVWPLDSDDIVERNLVFAPYQPIRVRQWGKKIDYNFLHLPGEPVQQAVALQTLSGMDVHSLEGDAGFQALEHGDFTLKPDSPALGLGFRNIEMDFGVQNPELRALAEKIDLTVLLNTPPNTIEQRSAAKIDLSGATFRNLTGIADISALGAPSMAGALTVALQPDSPWSRAGLQANDLLIRWDQRAVLDTAELKRLLATASPNQPIPLTALRKQMPIHLTFRKP